MKKLLAFLTLFTSFGTLICCALPALFVSLGMGATLISAFSAVPQLIWFSEHKNLVFVAAGIMLLISGCLRIYAKNLACPIDPDLRDACVDSKQYGAVIFWLSCFLYLTGAFFAFLAPIFFE